MTLSVRSLALAIVIAAVVLIHVAATSQSGFGPKEDNTFFDWHYPYLLSASHC